jgi:serine/threonine protein kinase
VTADRDFELIEQALRKCAEARRIGSSHRYASERFDPDSQNTIRPAGDWLPNYTILRELHRGGQGVVYLARQKQPPRDVALKVLREGPFANPGDHARFEREIQVLAGLRHPNIISVHDSGTAGGFFYYAMDYIEGKPLDQAVAGFEVRSSLSLFAKICDAVNAAHLRGIIHRDLKPGNILIDGAGEPHILDFGLAKIDMSFQQSVVSGLRGGASAVSTESSQVPPDTFTITGQFVGSPPWASPEQARGRGAIDLRSDVYSLGVMLYQALAGRFPYAVTGEIRDVIDNICNSPAPPPSRINRRIDRDADTIVLKCLEKEPQRRYQSAGELAADIRRYLADEPIDARRASTFYVVRKVLRRNWAATIAGVASLLAITGFSIAMTVMYQDQIVERRRADRAAADALLEKARAERFAEEARKRFHAARSAVEFLVDQVSAELEPLFGTAQVRREILQRAFEQLRELTAEHSDDPALQLDLAQLHGKLSGVAIEIGDDAQATEQRDRAMRLTESVLANNPDDRAALQLLGKLEQAVGDQALRRGDTTEAERWYAVSSEKYQRLLALEPENPERIRSASMDYERQAMLARARSQPEVDSAWTEKMLAAKRRAIELAPSNSRYRYELSVAEERVASNLFRAQKMDESESHIQAALELREQLLQAAPEDRHYLRAISISYEQMANLAGSRGQREVEQSWLDRMYEAKRRMVGREPNNRLYQHDLAICLDRLGSVARAGGKLAEALTRHTEALAIYRRLCDAEPSFPRYRDDLAGCMHEIGLTHRANQDHGAAEASYAEALEVALALHREQPKNRAGLDQLIRICIARARNAFESDRLDDEKKCLLEAKRFGEELSKLGGVSGAVRRMLSDAESRLARGDSILDEPSRE